MRDWSLITVVALMAQRLTDSSFRYHLESAKKGGGQILICVSGRDFYQEWGRQAQELIPGDVVNIPAGAKHWHGATPYSWFSHLAVEVPAEEGSNEWLEKFFEIAGSKALLKRLVSGKDGLAERFNRAKVRLLEVIQFIMERQAKREKTGKFISSLENGSGGFCLASWELLSSFGYFILYIFHLYQ